MVQFTVGFFHLERPPEIQGVSIRRDCTNSWRAETADLLLLKTPYSAREVVDWILQAKLVAYFGEAVKELRRHGVRTVGDLHRLTDKEIEELPPETTLTHSALKRSRQASANDAEIERLLNVSRRLGQFTRTAGDLPAQSASA